ncbi:MAG: hypothetical protein [Inoviridae sp.]|nr:MAG: hypothetical protein [Inoviridae sp.]
MLGRNALEGKNRSPHKKIILGACAINVDTEKTTHIGNFSHIGNVAVKLVILTEVNENIIHNG